MIIPIDVSDKSYYPAYGVGLLSGLLSMIKWLFPLDIFTGLKGYFLTVGATGLTVMTTLIVTGLYKRHEIKILNFFDKRPKFLRNGKTKKDNSKAA